jgi:phage terminase Nu1 subunit (DNA packaging protein)
MSIVNTNDLAEYLDLTRSRIADLKKDKIIIPEKGITARGRGGGNLYDTDKNRIRYIRFLRKMKAVERGKLSAGKDKKSGSTNIDGLDYKTKLEKEQWREKKRKNDIAENEITDIATVQVALMRVAGKLSTIIEKIIPNIVRFWPEIEEEVIETIQKSIDQALIESANIQLNDEDLITDET